MAHQPIGNIKLKVILINYFKHEATQLLAVNMSVRHRIFNNIGNSETILEEGISTIFLQVNFTAGMFEDDLKSLLLCLAIASSGYVQALD